MAMGLHIFERLQKGVTAVTMSPTQDALAAQTLCIWHHGPLKEKGQTKASLNCIQVKSGRQGDRDTHIILFYFPIVLFLHSLVL